MAQKSFQFAKNRVFREQKIKFKTLFQSDQDAHGEMQPNQRKNSVL